MKEARRNDRVGEGARNVTVDILRLSYRLEIEISWKGGQGKVRAYSSPQFYSFLFSSSLTI